MFVATTFRRVEVLRGRVWTPEYLIFYLDDAEVALLSDNCQRQSVHSGGKLGNARRTHFRESVKETVYIKKKIFLDVDNP